MLRPRDELVTRDLLLNQETFRAHFIMTSELLRSQLIKKG